MAIRLKDRIEANIRQSDKVNSDLKIHLQGSNTTYLYAYNGSEAKTVYIYPDAIGALPTSGGTMTGILELAGTGPFHYIRRSLEIQRKITDNTYKKGYTWTNTNADDSTKVDTNVLGENNDGFHIYTYYSPPYGYVKTYPDNSTANYANYGVAAIRMQSIDYGTGNFSNYYSEYRLPTNRAGLTSNIVNYFNTSNENIGGINKPVYVSSQGRLIAGNTYVPTSGGTFNGIVLFNSSINCNGSMIKYGQSGYYAYIDYYRKNNAGTAGVTDGYTWASGNTGAQIAWTGYAIGGIETNGTTTKIYSTYWATRAYSINSTTGARLNYHYTFRLPSVPNNLTASATRYIAASSSANRGSINQPVYLSGGYLYTCNTFVPNTGGTFTGNIAISGTYYPSFELTPTTVNSTTSTYPKAVFEGSCYDNVSMWIWGDKTNSAKSRRGLVLYNYSAQSNNKKCIALRQCDTSGNWQADLYLLHSGNYNSYALPLSGGTMTGKIGWGGASAVVSSLTSSNSTTGLILDVGMQGSGIYKGNGDNITTGTGGAANIIIKSWYGVGFATSCYNVTNQGITLNINTRTGDLNTVGKVYGAVWNDYAEYRSTELIQPGRVVREDKDGIMKLTTERLMPACEIISDTFGFAIGETDECKTPIAATGRVLAYTYEDRYLFELGDAVCSGPNGTVSKMTRQELMMYPERMIGTVSEIPEYKTWGSGNVEVDGRIWIRIR